MKGVSSPQYFIGLMSGTSTDGVDGVLALFKENTMPTVLKLVSLPMPDDLRETLLSLNVAGQNELEKAALAANALVDLYAQCCQQLLQDTGLKATQISAIGAHGQTVRHRPDLGFTLQLNAPARLAEITGIDVVADFRSRDIAAGGQGAPFAPLFHEALFKDSHKTRVVLNLGGIANITLLRPHQALLGFDTGPANVLMDLWMQTHTQEKYDKGGKLSALGIVQEDLLETFLDEPYFALPAPKSTGRDLFNATWLNQKLNDWSLKRSSGDLAQASPVDILASIRALTSHSITQAIRHYADTVDEIIVCGGGANNTTLMHELAQLMHCKVVPISTYGIDGQAVEALAFAWLAKAFTERKALAFPSITGSHKATIAGALYPH